MANRIWTEEDDQFLRENYGPKSASQIAALLGVSKDAVIGRAKRIRDRKRVAKNRVLVLSNSYRKPWRPGDPIPEHLRLI